jgi:hypothetical protein
MRMRWLQVNLNLPVIGSVNNSPFVRFEAFTAVTMKNVVFWVVALCRSCVNRCFGGTFCLHLRAGTSIADFTPLKMEAICSSETSVNARST